MFRLNSPNPTTVPTKPAPDVEPKLPPAPPVREPSPLRNPETVPVPHEPPPTRCPIKPGR